ncbi:apoptosis inhibitor [Carcinus maenas nudivirus]|uniref:Apoptosis inhibitor n=1 Tax=Carcinus maenas nudivirus TaxID=2880837 RepID=A0AAE8Y2P1_9VIRU|nr:apoptosis inhibitor [Carcinus maenas nudivirus]UBZ25682.1 apoptosis inhibitor [Carcinus maenas nudivirus]
MPNSLLPTFVRQQITAMTKYWDCRLESVAYLTFEWERFCTFNPSCSWEDKTFFSSNGFISLKHNDEVMCIYCGLILHLDVKKPQSGILKAHIRKSPQCIMHKPQMRAKYSIQPYRPCFSYRLLQSNEVVNLYDNNPFIEYTKARIPKFSNYEDRLETYNTCNVPYILNVKEICAKSGFVYMYSDILFCYHCKGGLKNLGTDYDKIEYLHAYFYPKCPHINLVGKASTLEKAHKDHVDAFEALINPQIIESATLNILHDAQIRINASPQIFLSRLLSFVDRSLKLENKPIGIGNGLNFEETQPEDNTCIICMTNSANVIIIPCKHIVCCANCFLLNDKTECPKCKSPIREISKILYS